MEELKIGEVVNCVTVVSFHKRSKTSYAMVECVCGKTADIKVSVLERRKMKDCGWCGSYKSAQEAERLERQETEDDWDKLYGYILKNRSIDMLLDPMYPASQTRLALKYHKELKELRRTGRWLKRVRKMIHGGSTSDGRTKEGRALRKRWGEVHREGMLLQYGWDVDSSTSTSDITPLNPLRLGPIRNKAFRENPGRFFDPSLPEFRYRHGRVTILHVDPQNQAYCVCDCGVSFIREMDYFRSFEFSGSCGCDPYNPFAFNRARNLTGQNGYSGRSHNMERDEDEEFDFDFNDGLPQRQRARASELNLPFVRDQWILVGGVEFVKYAQNPSRRDDQRYRRYIYQGSEVSAEWGGVSKMYGLVEVECVYCGVSREVALPHLLDRERRIECKCVEFSESELHYFEKEYIFYYEGGRRPVKPQSIKDRELL